MINREFEERMERWADWARSPSIGSGSSASGYLRERQDRAVDAREFTNEVAVTERAVARAKLEDKAYWRVISRYYLGRWSAAEIAGLFAVDEASIARLLHQAKCRVFAFIIDIEDRGSFLRAQVREND